MMGECSLPVDISTLELWAVRENDLISYLLVAWMRDTLEMAHDHAWDSLKRTAARVDLNSGSVHQGKPTTVDTAIDLTGHVLATFFSRKIQ